MKLAPAREYWADPLVWSAHLGIFVFGAGIAVLGAILPALSSSIPLNPEQAGTLFLLLSFGAWLATVAGGPVVDRFGYRLLLVPGAGLCGAGIAGLSDPPTYAFAATASLVLGMGGGALNVGTNALVAELYPSNPGAALNRLGVFFGMGTLMVPLLIGSLSERLGMSPILLATAGCAAGCAAVYAVLRFPVAKHRDGFPVRQFLELFRHPLILILAVLLFFQSGNEITTSGWLTSYAVDRWQVSVAEASFYLAAFWGGLILGRLAASALLGRLQPPAVVQLGALGAAVSLGFLPFAGYPFSFLTGFFMALIFPTVVGIATARHPAFSGSVIGLLMAVALLGSMLAPWLTGVIAASWGIPAALWLPCAGYLVVFLLQTVARRW